MKEIKNAFYGLVIMIIILGCGVPQSDYDKLDNENKRLLTELDKCKNDVERIVAELEKAHTEEFTLLKYNILKEDISDTPLKTEILVDILLQEKDSVTEKKLKTLLNTLYIKHKNRTGFKHHEKPNTVAIYVYSTKQKANSGMGQWIAMISKLNMTNNDGPKFKINRTQYNSLFIKDEVKFNLTSKQRRKIWDKLILAERFGSDKAFEVYPIKDRTTMEEWAKAGKLAAKLQLQEEKKIIRKYKINRITLDSIGLEGVFKGWSFPED